MVSAVYLTLGSTRLDEQDIAILHDIFLTLGHDLAGSLDRGFVTTLLESIKVEDNGLNESLLKICKQNISTGKLSSKRYPYLLTSVDDTSSLRGLGSLADGPLSDFVRTASEEAAQVQNLAHSHNDLRQGRLGAQLLALLISLGLALKAG